MQRSAAHPKHAPVHRRLRVLRALLLVAALLIGGAAAAQASPPWGPNPYQAEIVTTMDGAFSGSLVIEAGPTGLRYTAFDGSGVASVEALLVWDGRELTVFVAEEPDGRFEPMPGFEAAVLASVVDPSTPDIGLCDLAEATCVREGDDEVGGRRAVRWTVDAPGLGRAVVWVDAEVGLTLATDGTSGDVVVRSELVRFDPTAPDPSRLRP